MADSKVSNLADIGSITTDDLLYIVDSPGTTPASRKGTVAELITMLKAQGMMWTQVTAASDQDVTSNTTPQDDNELRFDMDAGAIYTFQLFVSYSSPAGGGTPDMKFTTTGPATLTGNRVLIADYLSTTDTNGSAQSAQSHGTTDSIGTATTPRLMTMMGWASSSGGGTGASGFRFQFSQATSNGNPTRRLAGSILLYRKLI